MGLDVYIQTPNLGIFSQSQSHFPDFFNFWPLFLKKRRLTSPVELASPYYCLKKLLPISGP
jgi:hypothetical protein